MKTRLKNRLQLYLTQCEGVAAVELGMIAPVLVVALLGLIQVSQTVYSRTQMHAAVRSGAQYFMAGGTDANAARDVIIKSWASMPSDGVVNVTNSCTCGEASGICGQLCPNQSYPDVFYRIEATAMIGKLFDVPISVDENVRAR